MKCIDDGPICHLKYEKEFGVKMIIEDQLTKYERLRLECFAQAINSNFTIRTLTNDRPTIDDLFEQARKIETFLKASNPN